MGATDLSGPLWLTNTVTVDLKDDKGEALAGTRIVVLRDFEREQRVRAADGKAEFKGVLVGPVQVRLAQPRFTDLAWSEPKVPVGEAAEAVFSYEDAIEGMKVSVFVHEHDADGTSTEVDRFEDIELDAEKGEVRVSWMRSEQEAQADLVDDERAGDVGPLEYRYHVVPEDGRASEPSEPLWLTNAVTIRVPPGADGETDGFPMIVVLRDAAGEEMRMALQDGQASFKDVLVGAIDVRLEHGDEGE